MWMIMERFEERYPLLTSCLFQLAVGIGLIGAVAGIALLGGSIIWMFYRLVGVM